jgi:threonylcarbamoyladenosine tRNA methylthiotransferase MtaB
VKYSVITFGCRVNQADSLGFEADLLETGLAPAPLEDADLVVVNTCSVTASADQAARQAIRRVSRLNPRAKIVVTGCYATRQPGTVRDLPNVSSVVPNDGKPRLIPILRREGIVAGRAKDRAGGLGNLTDDQGSAEPDPCGRGSETTLPPEVGSAARYGDGEGSCGATLEPGMAGRTAYTLRVQTGCGERCSYCIIPSTRGLPRSRPLAAVLESVRLAAEAGFKEIVITGVHLGSYGRDLGDASSLSGLLRSLAGVKSETSGLLFRISSLEPMDCTSEVVDLMAGSSIFAPHFHLPLQHASARVLRRMNRPYTLEDYAALVEGIRTRVPHASIGSDVIVGFPGEDTADFEELASYLERSPLTHLHVFPYSDRPGTLAASMTDKVSGVVVRERSRKVREISETLSRRFRDSQVGTVHQALTIDDGATAVTGNYLKLRIPPGQERNRWIAVRVVRKENDLWGEPVGAELPPLLPSSVTSR